MKRCLVTSHKSLAAKRGAFTLIELLVVISIIAFLMGFLVPTLGRVRRQAKSVLCQSNLRQWGVAFSEYLSDNHNQMPIAYHGDNAHRLSWFIVLPPYLGDRDDILLCPMATKRNLGIIVPDKPHLATWGSTFVAWGPATVRDYSRYGVTHGRYGTTYGSYGINDRVCGLLQGHHWHETQHVWEPPARDRNAARIPLLLDGIFEHTAPFNTEAPPDRDGIPRSVGGSISLYCINRHDGGVNSVYMDGHVRKVGLKELWTLKWGPNSDAAGRWTLAGGVNPEDWPEWMKGFKDY